jgi:hypothetical protein
VLIVHPHLGGREDRLVGHGIVTVMARRPSKHLRAPRPLAAGHATSVDKSDGRWIVRSVPGAAATKPYRCPGCDHPVPAGTPHVVAWPSTPELGLEHAVDARRHWHTACWERRR